ALRHPRIACFHSGKFRARSRLKDGMGSGPLSGTVPGSINEETRLAELEWLIRESRRLLVLLVSAK
ncbi:hypothetical protein CRG98_048912, partial [Punica granatum]